MRSAFARLHGTLVTVLGRRSRLPLASAALGFPVLGFLVLGLPGSAHAAEPVPVRIQVDAPADCAAPRDFYDALRARSSRVREAMPGEKAYELSVKLEPGADVVHGELSIASEQGEADSRSMDGASCSVVVQALSLTAALAFEAAEQKKEQTDGEAAPLSTAGEHPEPSAGAKPPPPAQESQEQPDSAHAPDEADRVGSSEAAPGGATRLRLGVGAGGLVHSVLSTQVSLGAALVAWLEFDSLGVSSPAVGLALAHSDSEVLDGDASVSAQWTGATLSACPLRFRLTEAIGVAPCATGSGGRLSVSGLDVDNPRSANRSWWSLGALARLDAALGSSAELAVEAGATIPLARREFVTTPSETSVATTPAVSPQGSLSLIYRF
jgi:hypothetical protein